MGAFDAVSSDDPDDRKARLEALERKLAAKRPAPDQKNHMDEHYSQAQHAWRMVIEMVAGLGIGLGIGYGLDTVFGTIPVFLIIFTLLGFAAGINVVLRTAKEIQRDLPAATGNEEKRDEGGN